MNIDISGFEAIPMVKRPNFTGTRYYDNNTLVAKTCSRCHEIRFTEDFPINRKDPDGLASMCKHCKKVARASYYVKPKRKPRVRAKGTPEQARKKRKDRDFVRRSRTPDQILDKQKSLRPFGVKRCGFCREYFPLTQFNKNRDSSDGLSRYCKQCHSESTRRNYKKRLEKFWSDNGIPIECYVCGNPFKEKEHVIPLALEGPNEFTNLLPACVKCNRSKFDIPLYDWLLSIYPLGKATAILEKVMSYGVDPYPAVYSVPPRCSRRGKF